MLITVLHYKTMTNVSQGEKIDKLYQTSVDFIMKVVPTGYSVGIVTFSSSADIVANLKEMTSQNARDDLVKKVPHFADGGTAIGQGLLAGIQVLFMYIRAYVIISLHYVEMISGIHNIECLTTCVFVVT